MSVQVFNSEAITSFANALRSINETINRQCEETKRKVTGLSGSWRGPGASSAMGAIDRAFANSGPRYQILNSYVSFMENILKPNYTQTEDLNRILADNFK